MKVENGKEAFGRTIRASLDFSQGFLILAGGIFVEAAEDDLVPGIWLGMEGGEGFPRGYAASLIKRKAIDAAADGGKGD